MENQMTHTEMVAKNTTTITTGILIFLVALIFGIVTYNVTSVQTQAQVAQAAVAHNLCQQETHTGQAPFWGPCAK